MLNKRNLKLGYGGTKTEMQRLIKEASGMTSSMKELGVQVDANDMSFGNIVNAISVVQQEMGVAGTTALEAGTTISGSVNSMKSAWTNLITGLADGNADISSLMENLVTTIVGDGTESNLGVIGNILPAIQNLIDTIPTIASNLIPKLLPIVSDIISQLMNTLLENLPFIVDTIVDVFNAIIEFLTNPDNLEKIIESATYLIITLATGLISAIPKLILKLPQILKAIFLGLVEGIAKTKWGSIGLDILKGLLNGMLDFGSLVTNTIKKVGKKITNGIKDFFGIHSPSKLMQEEIGKFLPMGIAEGFEDEIPNTIKDVDKAMSKLNEGIQDSVNPIINPNIYNQQGASGSVNNQNSVVINFYAQTLDDEQVNKVVDAVNHQLGNSY